MIRTWLVAVLAGVVLALGALARGGEGAPAAGEKVALGRDLRAFPESDYEVVQSFESRTRQQIKDQVPQTTTMRNTFTFDLKFKPPGEKLADEGEAIVTVRRVQVEMEVGDKLIYDSAAKPELKIERKPEPKVEVREGEEKSEAQPSKKRPDLAMQLGQSMAKQFSYVVGRSSRAAVRLSLLPNRTQIESFEGLDAAWDQYAIESQEKPKEPGKKLGETSVMMLKRNYGDAMLNRMLAQGVEFLPPPPPRDAAAPPGTVRKAAAAVGDTWKVTRRLLGARFQPVEVEHTCKLIAVKDGEAIITVAWKFDHKDREGGTEEKPATVSRVEETGSVELAFHAASAMLTGLKSNVTRAERTERMDETGKAVETTSRALETRSFLIRPKI